MSDDREIHVPACFGCGQTNPIGLKLDFAVEDDRAIAEFSSTEHHVRPPGIVHGGVIAAIIDEALSFVCRSMLNHPLRTARQESFFGILHELERRYALMHV